MTSVILLVFASLLAIGWIMLTIDEIEKYRMPQEYEPTGRYKLWLLICLVWTPIAIFAGPVLFQVMIMGPMTVYHVLVFYFAELS